MVSLRQAVGGTEGVIEGVKEGGDKEKHATEGEPQPIENNKSAEHTTSSSASSPSSSSSPSSLSPDKHSLYKQVLSQFVSPLSSQNKAQWLDQDLILHLKGIAVLAQNPQLVPTPMASASSVLSRIIRGVKLITNSQGSGVLQQTISRALATSLNSYTVSLTRDTMDAVRRASLDKGVPNKLVSKSSLLSALFDLIEEQGVPVMVILEDDLHWLLGNQDCSNVMLEELKSQVLQIKVQQTKI
jgi:hypothetical protein